MYKISFVILLVAAFSMAIPLDFESEPQEIEERSNRERRVTCDLLSGSVAGVSLGHGACAAHCIAMLKGYRGGRCINGVCNCRK